MPPLYMVVDEASGEYLAAPTPGAGLVLRRDCDDSAIWTEAADGGAVLRCATSGTELSAAAVGLSGPPPEDIDAEFGAGAAALVPPRYTLTRAGDALLGSGR